MRVMVLAVPDCPNAMLLEERLAQVLDGRRDVSVSRQVVGDEQEAGRLGMHGSPTILVDGTDPFAEPGQRATVSCRLYRDSDGRVSGAPSVSQLRQVIGEPAAVTVSGSDAVWHPATAVVFAGRTASECAGPSAAVCCEYISFFARHSAAAAWATAHPEVTGGILSQGRALEVGEQIFGRLLQ
jgi:anaerobic selenocysteine-containing dehydrogenase